MTKQKLSVSEKIRRQLALGKKPKEISKLLKCSNALVYAVRSADKKKEEAQNRWNAKAYKAVDKQMVSERRDDLIQDALQLLPPKDYFQPKPSMFKRIVNWFCGV